MSGIFGTVGAVAAAELDEMGRRLKHRGTHMRWWRVADNVHLGAVGHTAPILHTAGSFSAVIDQPATLGVTFDAHDRLQTYTRGGVRELDEPGSAFAMAAWHADAQMLHLGRDLAGQKPLFIAEFEGGIAFASEYKCLLALEAVRPKVDRDAIQYLQVWKLAPPGSATLLQNITALPPGTVQSFDKAGMPVGSESMPPLSLRIDLNDETEAVMQLRQHLIEATERLVGGSSRIAIALSGGIDSLGVAHLSRRVAPEAQIAGFTLSHGPQDPETVLAQLAMEELGGTLHTVSSSPSDLARQLPMAVWHLEDPIGRTESYLFFDVARRAQSSGFHSLLSGMGSDALFAGMPRYKVLWLADLLPPLSHDLLEFFDATQSGQPSKRLLAKLMSRAYYHRSAPPLIPQVIGASIPPPEQHVPPGPEYLNRALLIDLLDHAARSLPRIERPLAAYGLDHGSPFYDRRVMDLSFRIPSKLKIHHGKEKFVLRRALQGLMSDRLANAHKGLMRMRQGNPFTAALQSLAAACLNPEAVEDRGWFTQESVAEVCKAARDPQCHHETTMRLWTLLLTEIWARTFIDRRGVCITHEELLGSADEPLLSWDGTRYQPTPSPRPPRPSHRA